LETGSNSSQTKPGSSRNRWRRLAVALAWGSLVLLAAWLAWPAAAQDVLPSDPTPEAPVYTVQPGDTLYAIAERFGSTVEAIAAANDLADPSLISVGQRLRIPTAVPERVPGIEARPDRRLHPVRQGETLPFLAFRYGTTVWHLQRANELPRLDLLWPEQVLKVPLALVSHPGVPQVPDIVADPDPVVQGQTLLLEVQAEDDLELSAWFLGQELRFVRGEAGYWALVGIDALTAPGSYPLLLEAEEGQSGDRLSLQETLTVTQGTFTTYNIVVPASRQSLLDPELNRIEREKVNAVFGSWSEERRWSGAFGLPLSGVELRITSPFGQRRSYSGGPPTSYHAGLDYGADEGVPVLAPITATVALAEPLQVRGNAVILDHGLGVLTGYWHLSRIDVVPGQVVGKGEVIGLVGNTGLSTGPHLHWEMRVGNVPVDPLQWTRRQFP
jgi:murein DD-endopeptidase MepM/ murein hydrolase activator NlpD